MSSESYADDCPNCGKLMECSRESYPPDASGECIHCGYFYRTVGSQMSVKEINALREEFNEVEVGGDMHSLHPRKFRMLTKLPRVKKSLLTILEVEV